LLTRRTASHATPRPAIKVAYAPRTTPVACFPPTINVKPPATCSPHPVTVPACVMPIAIRTRFSRHGPPGVSNAPATAGYALCVTRPAARASAPHQLDAGAFFGTRMTQHQHLAQASLISSQHKPISAPAASTIVTAVPERKLQWPTHSSQNSAPHRRHGSHRQRQVPRLRVPQVLWQLHRAQRSQHLVHHVLHRLRLSDNADLPVHGINDG